MQYKAEVITFLKDEVKDPQGEAVCMVLKNLDIEAAPKVGVGKYFTLKVSADNKELATEKINSICDKVLSNPLIENYKILEVKEV